MINDTAGTSQTSTLLFTSAAVVLFVLLSWGPNPFLAAYSIAVLLSALLLLWRPGESPVLLVVFGLQWLQASVKVFNSNLQGLPISDLGQFGGDISTSTGLCLTGLLLLALGMRYGAGSVHPSVAEQARGAALRYPAMTWFSMYAIALVISTVSQELSYQVSALSQPFLALASMKWAFFLILTYAVFSRSGSGRGLWMLAFAVELLLGIGGFFADFRSVFVFSVLGIVAAGVQLTAGRALLLTIVATLTICTAIVWTAVKPEYRNFVNGGQQAQVVEVDYKERMAHLAGLIGNLDVAQFNQGAEDFMNRLSYVDFFGAVINFVPISVPHTGGDIWLDALARPFMPRAFFPSKTAIDDSERTAEFTGLEVSGADRGTSISIGYMGESYIDFGPVGMMAPILLLGSSLGWVYRWLVVTGSMRGLLGMGMVSASLMSFSFLESSITKVFGGFVATLLVMWLIARFIVPRYLAWLVPPPSGQDVPAGLQPPAVR